MNECMQVNNVCVSSGCMCVQSGVAEWLDGPAAAVLLLAAGRGAGAFQTDTATLTCPACPSMP